MRIIAAGASLFILSVHFAHVRAIQWVALLLILGGTLAVLWRRWRDLADFPPAVLMTVAAWSGYTFLTLTWSVVPGKSLELWSTDVLLPLCALLGAWFVARHPVSVRWSLGAWLAALVGLAAISLLAVWSGETTWLKSGDGNPSNHAALLRFYPGPGLQSTFMVVGVAMLIWLAAAGARRWLVALAALSMLVSAFATFNRMTALVLILLGGVAFMLNAMIRRNLTTRQLVARAILLASTGAVLAVAGYAVITAKRYGERLDARGMNVASDALTRDIRITMWRYWSHVALQAPVFGHGFGKLSGNASHDPQHPLYPQIEQPEMAHPHNLFVSLWVQTGAIGVLLFFAMHAALLREGVQLARAPQTRAFGFALVLLVIGLLAKNASDDFYDRSLANLFFVYVGLLLGATHARITTA